jgi:hypothetical protein
LAVFSLLEFVRRFAVAAPPLLGVIDHMGQIRFAYWAGLGPHATKLRSIAVTVSGDSQLRCQVEVSRYALCVSAGRLRGA